VKPSRDTEQGAVHGFAVVDDSDGMAAFEQGNQIASDDGGPIIFFVPKTELPDSVSAEVVAEYSSS
jgi:hypothetical protein